MAAAARTARPRFFSIIAPVVIDSRSHRGPIPKLPGTRGTFVCELRNPRTTGNSMISSAPFEPADRDRFYRTMCANFGFGALIGHVANGLQRGADNIDGAERKGEHAARRGESTLPSRVAARSPRPADDS